MYPDGACEIRIITLDLKGFKAKTDDLLTECGANSISSRISWSPDGKTIALVSDQNLEVLDSSLILDVVEEKCN